MTRNLPYSEEAERAVLGSVLIDNGVWPLVSTIVSETDFYIPANSIIFGAMANLAAQNRGIDPVTVGNHLRDLGVLDRAGGAVGLSALLDAVATSVNAETHASIVRQKSEIRRIIRAGEQIAASGYTNPESASEYATEAQSAISEATRGVGGETDLATVQGGLSGIVGDVLDGNGLSGQIKTGLRSIDKMTGGIYRNLLTVIGGRPSMGKSALALNIASNMASSGLHVSYFSLEDAREFVQRRLLARYSQCNLADIIHGRVSPQKHPDIIDATRKITGLPLSVSDRGQTSDQIRQALWRQKQRGALDVAIVDHLGYVTDKGREYDVTSEVCRKFAHLAKELEIAVVLLVQLNRGFADDKEGKIPTLKNLRGSGHIEEDARAVWFCFRPWYYDTESEDPHDYRIIVAKSSHGPTGIIKLRCDFETMSFCDIERGEY